MNYILDFIFFFSLVFCKVGFVEVSVISNMFNYNFFVNVEYMVFFVFVVFFVYVKENMIYLSVFDEYGSKWFLNVYFFFGGKVLNYGIFKFSYKI